MSASNSLINYTRHNKSSILQLSGLLYYLLLTCAQNTNVSQTGSGCSHKMITLFSQRSRRVPVEQRSVSEMQLLQLFLGKRISKQTVVIDNRQKCTVGTFHRLRGTTAAQVHHLIRYGREKGPDVMDWVQYRYLIVLVLKKKKSISCFHQSQSWLLVKKPTLLLHPVLLWWRWVHLCTASFDATSEGALSCSQTFHQLMSPALCRLPIPLPRQPSSAPASGWGQTALDWAWRCVGWVKTACSLWSLYANYLQILRETAAGDVSKCGACVAASADASLLVMKTPVQSKVACF